jgi:hypothetical protein
MHPPSTHRSSGSGRMDHIALLRPNGVHQIPVTGDRRMSPTLMTYALTTYFAKQCWSGARRDSVVGAALFRTLIAEQLSQKTDETYSITASPVPQPAPYIEDDCRASLGTPRANDHGSWLVGFKQGKKLCEIVMWTKCGPNQAPYRTALAKMGKNGRLTGSLLERATGLEPATLRCKRRSQQLPYLRERSLSLLKATFASAPGCRGVA